jgi:hypothetical protein
MTTRCSTWSFVEAMSAAAVIASVVGSPVRDAVPASGCDRTTSPWRATSSSGDAPTNPSNE